MRALLAIAAVLAALLFAPTPQLHAANGASFDDTAKFLAGLQPSANSPLAEMAREPGWQQHARHFDAAWSGLDSNQLARARDWIGQEHDRAEQDALLHVQRPRLSLRQHLLSRRHRPTCLSGLERVGPIPDVAKLRPSRCRHRSAISRCRCATCWATATSSPRRWARISRAASSTAPCRSSMCSSPAPARPSAT